LDLNRGCRLERDGGGFLRRPEREGAAQASSATGEASPIPKMRRLEVRDLRSKISSAKISPKSRAIPKAFTEKGLYMLATVLKSKRATAATFAIIETFVKVRGLKRELVELHKEADRNRRADEMRHFGETLADIVMPDLEAVETESSLELNFFIGKLKHTVRRTKKQQLDVQI
jgi:hypothetical protein